MASQQQSRIQFYLEKNKIGPLFEEMMTKLITETPDHPIPFLISHLQTKHGSTGRLHRTLSGSAALWAESGSSEAKGMRRELRSYEKPWQLHPKKPKKSKSDLAVSNISPPSPESKSLPRSIEHPSWEWRSRPESRDYEELNHILQESKKLGKALENLSRSIAVSDELDQDPVAYKSSMVRPRVVGEWVGREEEDADPLAAEMLQPPVPRAKTEGWKNESNSPSGSLKVEPKTKGLKQQQQHHKKLLAAMLSQDSFDSATGSISAAAEEDIDDEDDAMELLEDLDDLRMEGVISLAPSGSKFSQGRGTYCPEPQAKVTLNICSRCARLQGDSLTAAQGEEIRGGGHRENPAADMPCPLPVVGALVEDEGECENASQVTGSRHPVWEVDLKSSGGALCQKGLKLKDSLFTKELQSMEKHLAEVEKDLAKLSEGKLARSPNSPQGSVPLVPPLLLHNTMSPSQSPLLGSKPVPLGSCRAPIPSSPGGRPLTPSSGGRARTPSRPHTPSGLSPRALTPASHGNREEGAGSQRSRPVTPTGQVGRPLTTPPGLSTADAVGKPASQRSSLSEDEFYHQLQAVRQPWLIPTDTESECATPPQKDRGSQSAARDTNKRSVFSGL